ncbi:transposase [Mesorhizobium sp. M0323]
MAAIGDIARFKSPQKLVSYFGLNPRVRHGHRGHCHCSGNGSVSMGDRAGGCSHTKN